MITFNTPCLRWKLILALKGQYGWPGFIAPYATRYLAKLVVISQTPTYGYGTPNQGPTITQQQLWQVDRITGNLTYPTDTSAAQAEADFPYGLPLVTGGAQSETWEVTETYFKHVYNTGYFVVSVEVTLSDQYDLATLDADANALLNSVSVLNMPWNTLQLVSDDGIVTPNGPYSPTGDLTPLLPPQVTYSGIYVPGPIAIPQLNAAAWSIYAPGNVNSNDWNPNGYSKLVGYVAMAGNYCEKIFTIDYNQNLLNQSCQSGVGSCANPFKVTPPGPLTPGQNAYVLIVPNCQCG